jgi:hypothetical protein
MPTLEQVKASITGMSVSDRSDILLYMLRLKYKSTVEDIYKYQSKNQMPADLENIEHCTYDELLERLLLVEAIFEGLQQSRSGQSIGHSLI